MQKVGNEPLALPGHGHGAGPGEGDAPGDARGHLQQHRSARRPPPRGAELRGGAGPRRRPWPARWARGCPIWSTSCRGRWAAGPQRQQRPNGQGADQRRPLAPELAGSSRRCWPSCGCRRTTTWWPCATTTAAGSSGTSGRAVPALDETGAAPVLRQGGVYLITGGLGGIGADHVAAAGPRAEGAAGAGRPHAAARRDGVGPRLDQPNPNDPATARIRVVRAAGGGGRRGAWSPPATSPTPTAWPRSSPRRSSASGRCTG